MTDDQRYLELEKAFMVFHNKYEDDIANCDKDAFDMFYTVHHESPDYESLKKNLLQFSTGFRDLLKEYSSELVKDLDQLIQTIE